MAELCKKQQTHGFANGGAISIAWEALATDHLTKSKPSLARNAPQASRLQTASIPVCGKNSVGTLD
jgi:hypothetical protein